MAEYKLLAIVSDYSVITLYTFLPPPPQVLDLLWSDPQNSRGCQANTFRGGGTYFGPDITRSFLEANGLRYLVRSHECKTDGYELMHGGSVSYGGFWGIFIWTFGYFIWGLIHGEKFLGQRRDFSY